MSTTSRPAVKGTPEQRRAAREQRREANRAQFVRARAHAAATGRERLVVACNAALAVGKRLDDHGRMQLAQAIAEAAERLSMPKKGRDAA